jgi:hypothetical protein
MKELELEDDLLNKVPVRYVTMHFLIKSIFIHVIITPSKEPPGQVIQGII